MSLHLFSSAPPTPTGIQPGGHSPRPPPRFASLNAGSLRSLAAYALPLCGVLWLGITSCGSSTETAAEPRLVPASAFNPSDPREAFRFVDDEAARERARRREPPRCEFRVESVPRGAAVDFQSSTIPKADLREQVARAAHAFNAYRSATNAKLDRLGSADHDWKMLLELRPVASVMDTSDGVRLLLEDPEGRNLLELRARVRWYAAGLLPDPVLDDRPPEPRQCLMDPPRL